MMKGTENRLQRNCEICGSSHKVFSYKGGMLLCLKHRGHMDYHGKILERTINDENEIVILEDCAELILQNRFHETVAKVKISTEDIEKIKKFKWHWNDTGYVASFKTGRKTILHRYIIGAKKGEVVDHINRDKLDCRRENLRICTQSENNKNSGIRKDNKTGVRGVRFDESKGVYIVTLQVNKKRINLGKYNDLEEATRVRREAETRYYGEFAPDWRE